MSDELRDVLEKVVDQAEANPGEPLTPVEMSPEEITPPTGTTPPVEEKKPSEAPSEALKTEEKPAVPATPPVQKKEAAPGTPTEPIKPTEHVTERAPASWTKEAKESWATVPLAARQEILRREGEVTKVLQETAQARELVGALNQITAPHAERIRAQGGGLQAINNLLQADHLLATGAPAQKAAFLAKMVKDYGVDVAELDNALAGQLQGKSNQFADIQQMIQQAIQPMMAPIQNWQQQQAQDAIRAQQEMLAKVQRMELDPKYEHFPVVRELMADLVDMHAKRGLALELEDAYNMAVQAHPETSKIERERAEQEAARQVLQRNQEAVAKARGAAVSVGSSVPTGSPAPAGGLTLRDTIEAAFTAAGSGGRI